MERSVALNKLKKILGKNLGYRVDPKAPTREEREAARTECHAAIAERKEWEEKKNARMREILESDVEYQTLCDCHKAARERADKLGAITRRHKITVGLTSQMFFHVKAEGDSWEEIIEKLTKEKAGA